jgi:hypothetical protein
MLLSMAIAKAATLRSQCRASLGQREPAVTGRQHAREDATAGAVGTEPEELWDMTSAEKMVYNGLNKMSEGTGVWGDFKLQRSNGEAVQLLLAVAAAVIVSDFGQLHIIMMRQQQVHRFEGGAALGGILGRRGLWWDNVFNQV